MNCPEYRVSVNIADALRYMGVTGEPDEAAVLEMQRLSRIVADAASPRVITRVLPVSRHGESETVLGAALRLEGKSAAALLNSSESCLLFCATLGDGIEALLRKWQIKDMAAAAMLDACASSAAECLCDAVEEGFRREYSAQGLYLTDRFSPGYGDLPIGVQKSFCAELDTARKIGVSVSASGIMIPRKTVTALLGISALPQKSRETGCAGCVLINNCKFREGKVTCYGQAVSQ